MSLYALSGLVNFIATSILGCFVFLKNRKRTINRTFGTFTISMGIWSYSYFLWMIARDESTALFWSRALMVGAIFIPACYLHFVFALGNMQKEKKSMILISYVLSFFFLVLDFSPLIVKSVTPIMQFPYWPQAGSIYWLFLLFFFSCAGYSIYLLFNSFRRASGVRRNQLKYVFIGTLLGYIGGSTNYPLWYHIKIAPIGNPLVTVYVFIVAYAIASYRLMDITLVVREATLRLVSSLIPAIVFLTIGIAFFSRPLVTMMFIFAAIASSLLYEPLKRLLQPVILGEKYDYQRLLKESTKSLVTMLDLRQLLNYIANTISETLGVEKISLFLKEGGSSRYRIKASCGLDDELVNNYVLRPNEEIISWLKQSRAVFIKEEMERALPGKAFESIYADLGKIKADFILPLFYKDNLVGVLNLSNKQSGGIYNQTDIDILESLGAEAAIAIENARLHTEVITDELTELYQPKYFELRLREEIEKAKRYKHCLSLMVVEVDNFEEFEKSYGQEGRDKILRGIAGIIRENLRTGDIACRCEEKKFGIILPEITEELGVNIKERLKKQIKETVEIGERLRRRVEEKELGVKVSIGIASFDGQDREMKRETMIKQAKEVLTQAKREGNTVKVFYDEKLRQEISSEVLGWIRETEETLVSGDIYVDLAKRTVQVNGEPIKLTPKAFDLLCLLMKKKGRVLNRSFLTESIWGYEYFGTTRTVDSHIKCLRQKLGSEGKKIETVKGVGYKFVDDI